MDANFWQLVATGLATGIAALAGLLVRIALSEVRRQNARVDALAVEFANLHSDLRYIKGRCDARHGSEE